ncbi:MAG TPA: DUF4382 domain-containing protein [Longimicrobiaceae bacterium]|nr:DUF4382 domain-containing protein [Longimicrobiaceae bacterium]
MIWNSKRLVVPALAGALVLGACDENAVEPGDDTSNVSVLLTDAPGDFEAAVVTITDIYFQPGQEEDAQRVYLLQDASVTTNLLTLANDALELVDDKSIPAGTYQQLRFVISGGYLAVENDEGGIDIYASSADYEGLPAGAEVTGTLQMPSFGQSGLKVKLPGASGDGDDGAAIVPEGDYTLLVDFDVSESFGHQAGNSGKWVMHPSLTATNLQVSGNLTTTLALADTVTLPILEDVQLDLGDFSATLTPAAGGDAKVVAFTDTDENGVFEANFVYLFPGEYQVGLSAPDALVFDTDIALPFTVTVDEGATATAAFVVTAGGLAQ